MMMMIVSTRASDEQVFLVVANGAATGAADGRGFHGSSDHEGNSAWFDSELNKESQCNGERWNAKIMRKEFDHPREKANSRTKDTGSERWCERWQAWLLLFVVRLLFSRTIQAVE